MARIPFDPKAKKPFKLSRTKIEDFIRCPRCFYLDVKLGVSRPPSFPFTLNNAVDFLLKKEFDIHRAKEQPHPLMEHYKIDAVPLKHKLLEEWRDWGIKYLHQPTNLMIFGKVDDLWIDKNRNFIVVDYKATSINGQVTLDDEYKISYKRQVEIYQWLFRKNGFLVSDTAYFVYVNALKDRKAFDGKLEFDVNILPYKGNDNWVEPTLIKIKETLIKDELPPIAPDCDFCSYRRKAANL